MAYDLLVGWMLLVIVGNAMPGADFFCITSVSLRSRHLGILCALGLQTGVICQSLIACFGTITIANYNMTAFKAIQVIGSLYLLYLAYKILVSVFKREREIKILYAQAQAEGKDLKALDKDLQIEASASMNGWQAYRTGFLCNIFNPKCFIFMATVLPQFVDTSLNNVGYQEFILCLVNLVLGIIHWICLAFLVSYLANKFASAMFRVRLEKIGGFCLGIIGLGLLVSLVF
ncbi:LysE family translocator [Psittacicella hinzii]|uniref:Uncharacterized protein n=1 Tax=Psittacicella hinzii TaxID=2028575 RepID=A0A3A1YUY1_9GAMM|nr:LysE family translocator [Psittacicella hinzii]RIY40640.1 hypothetical protein CKF58_00245 [Psittacicella hinzii]